MKNGSIKKLMKTTKNSRTKKMSSISKSQNIFIQKYFRKMNLNFKIQKCIQKSKISLRQQRKGNDAKKKNSLQKFEVIIPNNNKKNNYLRINDLFPSSKQIKNNYQVKSPISTPRNHSQQQLTLKNNNKNNNIKRKNRYCKTPTKNIINQQIKNNSTKEKWKNESSRRCTSLGNSIDSNIHKNTKASFTFSHQLTKKRSISKNVNNVSNSHNNIIFSNMKLNNILTQRNNNNNNFNSVCNNILIKSKNKNEPKKNCVTFQHYFKKQNSTYTTSHRNNRYKDINNDINLNNNSNTSKNKTIKNKNKNNNIMYFSIDKINKNKTQPKEYYHKKNNLDLKNSKKLTNATIGKNRKIRGEFFNVLTGKKQVKNELKSSPDNKLNSKPVSGNHIKDEKNNGRGNSSNKIKKNI